MFAKAVEEKEIFWLEAGGEVGVGGAEGVEGVRVSRIGAASVGDPAGIAAAAALGLFPGPLPLLGGPTPA